MNIQKRLIVHKKRKNIKTEMRTSFTIISYQCLIKNFKTSDISVNLSLKQLYEIS